MKKVAEKKKRTPGNTDRANRGVVLIPVEVSEEFRKRLTDAAHDARITRADWIRDALEKKLEKQSK